MMKEAPSPRRAGGRRRFAGAAALAALIVVAWSGSSGGGPAAARARRGGAPVLAAQEGGADLGGGAGAADAPGASEWAAPTFDALVARAAAAQAAFCASLPPGFADAPPAEVEVPLGGDAGGGGGPRQRLALVAGLVPPHAQQGGGEYAMYVIAPTRVARGLEGGGGEGARRRRRLAQVGDGRDGDADGDDDSDGGGWLADDDADADADADMADYADDAAAEAEAAEAAAGAGAAAGGARPAEARGDIVSASLLAGRAWEPVEVGAVVQQLADFAESKRLRRDQVWLLDAGANLGAFTLAAAAAGFRVLAFEPMALNLAALRRSLCVASNAGAAARVALLPLALGGARARCALWSADANLGDGTVDCTGREPTWEADGFKYVRRQRLDVEALDSLVAAPGGWAPPAGAGAAARAFGAVKADVEGFEPQVFAGAAAFLAAARPAALMLEVSAEMMRQRAPAGGGAAAGSPLALLRSLEAAGYELRGAGGGFGGFEGPRSSTRDPEFAGLDAAPGLRNVYLTLRRG